jgi:hypothetical protein
MGASQYLHITVIEGRYLPKMDAKKEPPCYNDTYVRLTLKAGGKIITTAEAGDLIKTTPVVWDVEDPKWNASFVFHVPHTTRDVSLVFEVTCPYGFCRYHVAQAHFCKHTCTWLYTRIFTCVGMPFPCVGMPFPCVGMPAIKTNVRYSGTALLMRACDERNLSALHTRERNLSASHRSLDA